MTTLIIIVQLGHYKDLAMQSLRCSHPSQQYWVCWHLWMAQWKYELNLRGRSEANTPLMPRTRLKWNKKRAFMHTKTLIDYKTTKRAQAKLVILVPYFRPSRNKIMIAEWHDERLINKEYPRSILFLNVNIVIDYNLFVEMRIANQRSATRVVFCFWPSPNLT